MKSYELHLNKIPKEVSTRTLVMFCRSGSEIKPDFVGAHVEESIRTILFPYDPVA